VQRIYCGPEDLWISRQISLEFIKVSVPFITAMVYSYFYRQVTKIKKVHLSNLYFHDSKIMPRPGNSEGTGRVYSVRDIWYARWFCGYQLIL
jgi:hypothetical protein